MEFSVIMCTYNGEKYIREQVNSILAQSYLPKELIICDDCSNDATVQMLNEIKNEVPFNIQIILNKKNLGYVKNFEQACEKASFEYIVFSDQDDIWMPNKLERFRQIILENSNAELIFTDAELFGETTSQQTLWQEIGFNKKNKQKFSKNNFSYLLMMHWCVTGATMVCKKSLIKYSLPFSKEFAHDEWLALMASNKGTLLLVNETLTRYRIHGSQQIGISKNTQTIGYADSFRIGIERIALIIKKLQDNLVDDKIGNKDLKLAKGYKRYFEQRLCIYNNNIIVRFLKSLYYLLNGAHYRYTDNAIRAFFICIIKAGKGK